MQTAGFLMMSHTLEPGALAAQARVMADNGCECVYVVDSAGAMVLDGVTDRVAALVAELGADAQVGFHAHRNLAVGEANTILAVRAGAVQVDGSLVPSAPARATPRPRSSRHCSSGSACARGSTSRRCSTSPRRSRRRCSRP